MERPSIAQVVEDVRDAFIAENLRREELRKERGGGKSPLAMSSLAGTKVTLMIFAALSLAAISVAKGQDEVGG